MEITMKIYGLQKLTLLDFPGKVACTVFLNGCDFRCPYCHNYDLAEGRAPALMEGEELLAFLKKRTGLLDGVAITGGEPCLHQGLPELIRKIRDLGFAIKLDTNGCHPGFLSGLLEEGLLDYVAMDIKNSPEKYALTTGLADPAGGEQKKKPDLSSIRKSISVIMDSGVDYEFRTTAVREFHEAEDFHGIGKMIKGADRYFLQSFTDRDSVPFGGLHAPSPQDLAQYLGIVSAYVRDARLRGTD